jgi:hypothetical protein
MAYIDKSGIQAGDDLADFTQDQITDGKLFRDQLVVEFDDPFILQQSDAETFIGFAYDKFIHTLAGCAYTCSVRTERNAAEARELVSEWVSG